MPPLIWPRDPRCAPSKPPICGFVPYVQLNPSRGLTYTPRGTASLRCAEHGVDDGVERRIALEVRRVDAHAVGELQPRSAAVRIAEPRRRAEVVAQSAIDLQAAREARRNSVLEIGERVVDERAEPIRRVVLRVAVVAEVEAELVAMLVVEADPRQLILQLRRQRVASCAEARCCRRTAGSRRPPFRRRSSSSRGRLPTAARCTDRRSRRSPESTRSSR